MGYYTRFELEFDETNMDMDKFAKEFKEITGYQYEYIEKEKKWYNCKKDMAKISLIYPTIMFNLSGEGEDSADIWRMHFKNGYVQESKAIITFEPYDITKMKKYGEEKNKSKVYI